MLIAVDVDGTLFDGEGVAPEAVEALAAAQAQGHLVVIATGRRHETLAQVVPDVLALCDAVVAEDGGVLVTELGVELLAPSVDPVLLDELHAAGVVDMDVGLVAVGAPRRFEPEFRAAHARHPGERHVLVNKGSVTLVPVGCHKGTGLHAFRQRLGTPGLEMLAIGDAANDLPMFRMATFARAVANADDEVRAAGIAVVGEPAGRGVAQAVRDVLSAG